MSRAVANAVNGLGKLGQPIVVVNKTGSNGLIGASYVASRPKDQYLLMTQNGGEWGNWLTLPEFKVGRDSFKPVAMVCWDCSILTVRSDSPFHTMDDIIGYSKQNAGKIVFGGTSSGLSQDAILYRMMVEAGLKAEFVPFDGGGDVSIALLGGHITASWGNPSEVEEYLKSGDLRAIALAAEKRHMSFPNIPTTAEQGYPNVLFSFYRGVLAPKEMPDENIKKLAAVIEEAWKTDAFQNNYLKAQA